MSKSSNVAEIIKEGAIHFREGSYDLAKVCWEVAQELEPDNLHIKKYMQLLEGALATARQEAAEQEAIQSAAPVPMTVPVSTSLSVTKKNTKKKRENDSPTLPEIRKVGTKRNNHPDPKQEEPTLNKNRPQSRPPQLRKRATPVPTPKPIPLTKASNHSFESSRTSTGSYNSTDSYAVAEEVSEQDSADDLWSVTSELELPLELNASQQVSRSPKPTVDTPTRTPLPKSPSGSDPVGTDVIEKTKVQTASGQVKEAKEESSGSTYPVVESEVHFSSSDDLVSSSPSARASQEVPYSPTSVELDAASTQTPTFPRSSVSTMQPSVSAAALSTVSFTETKKTTLTPTLSPSPTSFHSGEVEAFDEKSLLSEPASTSASFMTLPKAEDTSPSEKEIIISSSLEERTVSPSAEERTAFISSTDHEVISSSAERRGFSSSAERRGFSSSAERRGFSSSAERRGFSSSVERRRVSPSAERSAALSKGESLAKALDSALAKEFSDLLGGDVEWPKEKGQNKESGKVPENDLPLTESVRFTLVRLLDVEDQSEFRELLDPLLDRQIDDLLDMWPLPEDITDALSRFFDRFYRYAMELYVKRKYVHSYHLFLLCFCARPEDSRVQNNLEKLKKRLL